MGLCEQPRRMVFGNTLVVESPNVSYTDDSIVSDYSYQRAVTRVEDNKIVATPISTSYSFKTDRKVPRLGVMLIGLGGNNGSTVVGGLIANREGISWETKEGPQTPNYFGSITQSSTVRIGADANGEDTYVPLKALVPMVEMNDLIVGGWDISNMNLADCMERAKVFDYDLQRQLKPYMKDIVPLPSIYDEDFVAANQRPEPTTASRVPSKRCSRPSDRTCETSRRRTTAILSLFCGPPTPSDSPKLSPV